MGTKRCVVCQIINDIVMSDNDNTLGYRDVNCKRCGKFKLDRDASIVLQNERGVTSRQRAIMSSIISKNIKNNSETIVTSEEIKNYLKVPDLPVSEKINRLLLAIADSISDLSKKVPIKDEYRFINAVWAIGNGELNQLFDFLKDELKLADGNTSSAFLTAAGWQKVEELQKNSNNTSNQVFIAMGFNETTDKVYPSIFAAIEDAGYEPFRIDRDEHLDKIDDAIIAQIRRSKFLVVDSTGKNSGAYFEAGFAMGLNMPIIWTCRRALEGESEYKAEMHFDTRQYNCLFWREGDDLDTLQKRLQNRIEAVLGRGGSIR